VLIIATGAEPRQLPALEGRSNAFVLRSRVDAYQLRDALSRAERAVIVGAGVIGCEVAASIRERGVQVTLVDAAPTPMVRSVGSVLGRVYAALHSEEGVDVRCSTTVTDVTGADRIEELHLSDGTILAPDVVIVGVGVTPCTDWLVGSGLVVSNGVVCDETLQAADDIWAVGDVANWPNEMFQARMRVEQWTNAAEQASHVARSIVRGSRTGFKGSNYFWSDQYGLRLQFVGTPEADEVVVIDGSLEDRRFLAWYRSGSRLVGACAIGLPKRLMASKMLIERCLSWSDALALFATWT
jgi:NADPH-dependent 2,4-dienoyl-CoA reductase/sulfur reductase-like enzyme